MARPAQAADLPGVLAPLALATAWFNSSPLTTSELAGKVVLVNFGTYTCINWQRQLPYVRAWAEKYTDKGLVVIAVHTPEFGFEKKFENVRRSLGRYAITFPVAADNDYAVWTGFDNHYWPALYLIDPSGRLRHTKFGEGDYAGTEEAIQRLLAENGSSVPDDIVDPKGLGVQAPADWDNLASPEAYLGHDRAEMLAADDPAFDRPKVYAPPHRLRVNQWAPVGDWTIFPQWAQSNGVNGRIVLRFHARDVHLVMGPIDAAKPVRFRVRVDGAAPGAARGTDVDADGSGTLDEQRLYQLIRQPGPVVDRTFEIEFLDPGAAAFAFTFG